MSFYLKPPKGVVNLHKLEKCLKWRMQVYRVISEGKTEFDYESLQYLVEDSMFDRAGHFLARVLASRSDMFYCDFLNSEVMLLKIRLDHYGYYDIKSFIQRLNRQAKDCLKQDFTLGIKEMLDVIAYVASCMLCKSYLLHIFGEEHHEKLCIRFIINVPFQYCCCLVQNRSVPLSKGYAEINCKSWKDLLLSLYRMYLRRFLKEMKVDEYTEDMFSDPRIQDLASTHYYFSNVENKAKFNIWDIQSEIKYFPLCMLNLYKVLENTNRLPHNERFEFSLYLKDIGLPLQDALKFWEIMFTKEHSSCSKCTHSWQKDSKRYIYGIRHLYGLEGSRKTYKARPCSFHQGITLGPTDCGGCPFKHFSGTNLKKALNMILPNQEEDTEVIIQESKKNSTAACRLFYKTLCKHTDGDVDLKDFSSPVEYYFSLKNAVAGSRSHKK